MMQSKKKITRTNAMDIIQRFAKEYRKALGKTPAEIIIVGGGSIMLNYRFRDISHRDYRNDISDAIGILIEEAEAGNNFSYSDIEAAYRKLYHEAPDHKTQEQFRDLCAKRIDKLKRLYDSQRNTEAAVGNQLISNIEDGVNINTKNVKDVAARIREKMNKNQ